VKLTIKDIWHILEGNYEDDYSALKIYKCGKLLSTEEIFFNSMWNLPEELLELTVISLTIDMDEDNENLPYIVLFVGEDKT
jgi:hypothetical protein